MPSEFRRLLFTEKELTAAIVEHCRVSNHSLPSGTVLGCSARGEPEVSVRIEMLDDTDGKRYAITLHPEFVGAALIRHVIKQGIPLPRRASKILEVSGDRVALLLTLGGEDARPPDEPNGKVGITAPVGSDDDRALGTDAALT